MLTGGHLKDIPKPHHRMYPCKNGKRPLRITVMRYSCGVHFWVTITEDDNPIWDTSAYDGTWGGSEGQVIGWHSAWDDKEGKGRAFSEQCNTPREARIYIAKVLRENFPADQYEIKGDTEYLEPYLTTKVTHLYKREGD